MGELAGGMTGTPRSSGIAALRTWFAIAPDGAEIDAILTVGIPYLRPGGEWAAEISLGALEPDSNVHICGVDSWQAIHLGMLFIKRRIEDYERRGWRFFWARNGESATAAHLGEFTIMVAPQDDKSRQAPT